MALRYNKVTWYSIVAAIMVYFGTFAVAFYLGLATGFSQPIIVSPNQQSSATPGLKIMSANFYCEGNKQIQAVFFGDKVELTLSDGRNMLLVQGISASGARYANSDESFVFWNKGDTAFVQEGGRNTYQNCQQKLPA